MSNVALAWAYRQQTPDAGAKAVLVCLAWRADSKTGKCWPSIATISADTQIPERTVNRKIKELTKAGLITAKRRRRVSNVYALMCHGGVSKADGKPVLETPNRQPRNAKSGASIAPSSGAQTIKEQKNEQGVRARHNGEGTAFAAMNGQAVLDLAAIEKATVSAELFRSERATFPAEQRARTDAERRWLNDLLKLDPELYQTVVPEMTLETSAAVTDAELARRGGGLQMLIGTGPPKRP
ncbi:helix-turn-helix domain-containing protein [Mesorhizobium sp. M0060]|uniref:helix-turn-helix domain-containing protein n=1 Tax=Mesorhizobium sp. M0060 TaxID=2956866 RepID=UPI00333A4F45